MVLDREQPIALASLAGASPQQGTLIVRTIGETVPLVTNRALVPAQAESPPAGEYTSIVGAYRFDPARDAQASVEAPIVVAPGRAGRELGAWAWRCRLDSRYTPDGDASHAATFLLETAGRARVRMSLPKQAEVRSLWIDDLRGSVVRDADGSWIVELPAQQRFPTIAVYYTTKEGPLGLVSWLTPAAPSIDVPVLSREMTLWLPPGYYGAGTSDAWIGPTERATWSQRLCGPLGRAVGAPAFDPFASDHWARLAHSDAEQVTAAQGQAIVERLGSALVGMVRNPARLDWGQLLAQFATELEKLPGGPASLFVDDAALAQIGITSRSPLNAHTIDAPAQRAAALLAESGAVLLVSRDCVWLTTAVKLATTGGQSHPVAPGTYAATQQDNAVMAPEKYLPFDAWRSQPPPLKTPWSETAAAGDAAGASPGWTAYRAQSSASDSPRLRVVHRESMIALGWTLFLAAAAGCLWAGRAYRERAIVAAGVLGVLTLLVPAAFVPPLTARCWASCSP